VPVAVAVDVAVGATVEVLVGVLTGVDDAVAVTDGVGVRVEGGSVLTE
jgi:hypothetical protein